MEALLSLDTKLFLFVNHLPHNSIFDGFALLLSGVGTLGILWLLLGAWLIYKEEKKDHRFWVPLFLSIATGWFFSEIILKNIFMRLRPTETMGAIIVGLNCCGYAFPSGHATVAFAGAAVMSKKEPMWRWAWYGLATLIAFSRIYLGKHYPLDVVAGGLLGWVIGQACVRTYAPAKRRR